MNIHGTLEKVMADWERAETGDGETYYINHEAGRTQWDHPFMAKTYEELRAMDNICYAAYRTASKILFLQKRLCLVDISLSSVISVCERHGLSGKDMIDVTAAENLLQDLYAMRDNVNLSASLSSEQLAELCLNWLSTLYDRQRSGKLRVLAVKTCLAVLSSARLIDKYKYIFQQNSERNGEISRERLTDLLSDLVRMTDILGESSSFGGMNVAPAVDSCFRGSFNPTGVCNDVFITWVLKEPQTLVWLPTMHRLSTAQSVRHEVKCSVCKTYPIIGLRYRCLKCFNYDLCQGCFFTGRLNKKHKLKHPTQEYCFATSSKENTKALMKTIKNNLVRRNDSRKLRYLPINTSDMRSRASSSENEKDKESSEGDGTDSEDLSPEGLWVEKHMGENHNPHPRKQSGIGDKERRELESIIIHLEKENRGLLREVRRRLKEGDQQTAEVTSDSDRSEKSELDWLEEEHDKLLTENDIMAAHNRALQLQLNRLKNIIHKPQEREPLGTISQNIQSSVPAMKLNNLSKPNSTSAMCKVYDKVTSEKTMRLPEGSAKDPEGLWSPEMRTALTPGARSVRLDDLTMASVDETLARTYFSLPSPSYDPSSDDADIRDLLARLDMAFPADYSIAGEISKQGYLDNVLEAAAGIGQSMMGFVRQLDNFQDDGSSIWRLADELGGSRDADEATTTFLRGHSTFSSHRSHLTSTPGGPTSTPPLSLPIDLSGGMSSA